MLEQIFGTVSQVVLGVSVPYFLLLVVLGIRVARRQGGRLGAQENWLSWADLTRPAAYHVYFLVPCLNEEAVIGETLRGLLVDTACRVVVIDDDSDDATTQEARRAAAALDANDRLEVLNRRQPDARQGKGPALNTGMAAILDDVRRRDLDPDRVIVAVMDADGRLSSGGTRAALPLFDDAQIGAVQLIVRIRNRRKLIARFQDIEFWMISAISQFARSLSGTVSLGGNGQFTRLSALSTLDGEPWSRSLTEDLDLGLRLIAAGWRVTTTTRAYVDQLGVQSYRRLLRQRTRWYQGHMSAVSRVPELWRSRRVSQVALVEATSYLLVPWFIVLPWSVLQQWVLFQMLFGSGRGIFATGLGASPWLGVYFAIWYLISFLPNLFIGFIYARRTRAVSLWQALGLAHLMIAWNYIGYAAIWRALGRIVLGRRTWAKTVRSRDEYGTIVPTPDPIDPWGRTPEPAIATTSQAAASQSS
jgi:1,2-diacylglycerol 3-beta-glucosyltransferase